MAGWRGWQGGAVAATDSQDSADVSGAGGERLHRACGELAGVLSGAEECQGPGGDAPVHARRSRLWAATDRAADLALAGVGGGVAGDDSYPGRAGRGGR